MAKLTTEARQEAIATLKEKLERAIGETPKGITAKELDLTWELSKASWN